MRTRSTVMVAGLVLAVALALLALPAVSVCRDWAFVDRNTSSRKGYREWLFGWRTGAWYQESALEAFMRAKHPADLRQDWVSYAGTGRSVFGTVTLRGHGRPGPILSLVPDVLGRYCRSASAADKRRFYDVLASHDEQRIRETIGRVTETILNKGPEMTAPAGAATNKAPSAAGSPR